jgi:hypothetical protein
MTTCILCGTEVNEDFCYECDDTALDMGLDYQELVDSF